MSTGDSTNPRYPHYFKVYRPKVTGGNANPSEDLVLLFEGKCRCFLPTGINKNKKIDGVYNTDYAISFPREDAMLQVEAKIEVKPNDVIEVELIGKSVNGTIPVAWHISNLGANIWFNESKT